MNILKINGTALTGIYVDAAVSFNKPAKRVETFSVPGRNGDLVIDEGTFDNVLISYPVYEKATFPDEFDAIVNWLASLQGYQRIECSNDPNHYRLGRFVVPQTPTAKRLNKDGYYTLTFDCKPQRWLLSGEEDTEITANPSTEYTGDVATFTATALDAITGVTAEITPIQNLNGQVSPWPAGGGKNKANPTTFSITRGTVMEFSPSLPSGTYVCSYMATRTGSDSRNASMRITYDDDSYLDLTVYVNTGSRKSVVFNATKSVKSVYFYSISANWGDSGNYTLTCTDFQLESGSTPTDFSPYSNICPISGHTECKVTRTGVNVWDEEWRVGAYNTSGAFVTGYNFLCSKNPIKVLPYTVYNSNKAILVWEYDEYMHCVVSGASVSANSNFRTSNDTAFINFRTNYEQTTYANDLSINYPATETGYHASGQTYLTDWGINQWDEEWEVGGIDASTGANTVDSTTIRSKNYIPVMGGQTYYVRNGSNATVVIHRYDANKNYLGNQNRVNQDITLSSDTRFIKLRFGVAYGTTYKDDTSINYPSTFTDYHAYADPFVGTVYGGTLDVTTGVLTIDRVMVQLGSLSWHQNRSGTNAYECYADIPTIKSNTQTLLSNIFVQAAYADVASYTMNSGSDYVTVKVPKSVASTSAALKTWLTDNGATLVYELATPTTVQLTPTEVEAILNSQNNVWADTGNVTVTVTSGTLFNNPSPFNAKPLIRVYGIGTFRINDNVVTIASHDKPYIDIDCELQECYYEGDNMSAYVSFSENDYPVLVPDDNYVLMVGVTKLDVTPRWWIL